MPTRKHFFSRQYWHWFLWCWSIWHSLFDLNKQANDYGTIQCIYNDNFLLSFNNFSEFATKATTVCWFPAGVRRSVICFCLNEWFSDFNLASKPQLQMCNQSHSTAYENVKKKESCSVMQMHNLLWKEYFNVRATTLPFYRAPDIVSWNYNFHELGNKKDHIWADGCIIQCYLNHTSQLSFLYNVHLIII